MCKLPDCMYDYRPEEDTAEEIGSCECCNTPIHEGDTHYNFNGELVCEDCLIDYCYDNYRVL